MMQQIMLNTHSQKTNQDYTPVGSENKKLLPATVHNIVAIDMVGLSWIFTNDILYGESVMEETN